ncbi:putative phosphate-transport integral membrane ABC transporter, PstA [Mycobacterium ulcerans str. Harvey]|uniref:Phosphate-transport integral membrane ABC transporter, PstA n=1 Tax=Mycobacterium ulcerans str. Harvey TaxID=1299332 RepID=A0ABN0R6H8_MYCUL|nr:putative phosphate-transport integral membrane ABC transporter, PstA [Mycobacterium ulcerans str. Harvey]
MAIYLVEYDRGGLMGRLVSFTVDILTGVPSIVAALFLYALWVGCWVFPVPSSRCPWRWSC